MQLLCLGDIAVSPINSPNQVWALPGDSRKIPESRVLFNMELPLGEILNPLPRARGPRLLSDDILLKNISGWSPGFAALATNHILDGGVDGLVQTIQSLSRAGFKTFGAGISEEEISQPLIWETQEGCLAVVNWVFPETNPDSQSIPGPNCWPGIEIAKRAIRNLKQEVEWVIVFTHWSDELFPYPRPEDRLIARELADAGMDLLVGHHPHVVRGMEVIGTCPIFYSLGNFYFSNFTDSNGRWIVKNAPRNDESLGIQVSFKNKLMPEYKVLSFWQAGKRVALDPLRRATRRMASVSRPLRQLQYPKYDAWYRVQRSYFDKWSYRWHFGLRRLGIRGLVEYLVRSRDL